MVTLLTWLGASVEEVRQARATQDDHFSSLEAIVQCFTRQVWSPCGGSDVTVPCCLLLLVLRIPRYPVSLPLLVNLFHTVHPPCTLAAGVS
jgi:hypothetical protein